MRSPLQTKETQCGGLDLDPNKLEFPPCINYQNKLITKKQNENYIDKGELKSKSIKYTMYMYKVYLHLFAIQK